MSKKKPKGKVNKFLAGIN